MAEAVPQSLSFFAAQVSSQVLVPAVQVHPLDASSLPVQAASAKPEQPLVAKAPQTKGVLVQ